MKAIVMETRGREAAILLKDGTFRTVKGRYSVGETIDYQETVRPTFRKWMAAAAAAVIMIGAGGGFWYDANYVAYAEISLDVNPSIVYTVNKRSRVLEVRAVNDEAAEAVSALNEEGVRFMPVADAIDRTMMLFENEGYLDAENEDYVLMNVSADNAGIHERVTSEIETGMGRAMERDPSMEYRVDHSDRATARRAEDSDMSTGRYAVWEQEGAGREQEEYAQMPVRELMGKPEESTPVTPGEGSAPQTEKDTPATLVAPGEGSAPQTEKDTPANAVAPDEGGTLQMEKDTPAAPMGGIQEQGAPDSPNQQPAQAPETGNNPSSLSESDASRDGSEQNVNQEDGQYEQDKGAVGEQERQPAAPGEKPDESPETGNLPSADTQIDAGTEHLQGESSPSVQQNGNKQDLLSPPNHDMQSRDMSQGTPINAPGGQGNQPPR